MVCDRSVRLSPLTVTAASDCIENIVGSAVDANTTWDHTLSWETANVCEAPAAV